ncbi:MAG: hypothetical protein LBG15_13365 [Dysgonamonadaceae bacterium]|nr:hypothetical protein [Dysgonamonadaceae bacterium]
MKNKIIYSVSVLAVAVLAAINMSITTLNNDLSDVSLSNVEALAYELDEVTITCSAPNPYGGQCYEMDTSSCGGSWCGCYFTGRQSDFCYYG